MDRIAGSKAAAIVRNLLEEIDELDQQVALHDSLRGYRREERDRPSSPEIGVQETLISSSPPRAKAVVTATGNRKLIGRLASKRPAPPPTASESDCEEEIIVAATAKKPASASAAAAKPPARRPASASDEEMQMASVSTRKAVSGGVRQVAKRTAPTAISSDGEGEEKAATTAKKQQIVGSSKRRLGAPSSELMEEEESDNDDIISMGEDDVMSELKAVMMSLDSDNSGHPSTSSKQEKSPSPAVRKVVVEQRKLALQPEKEKEKEKQPVGQLTRLLLGQSATATTAMEKINVSSHTLPPSHHEPRIEKPKRQLIKRKVRAERKFYLFMQFIYFPI